MKAKIDFEEHFIHDSPNEICRTWQHKYFL